MIDVAKDRSRQNSIVTKDVTMEPFLGSEKSRSSRAAKPTKACFTVGIGISNDSVDDASAFFSKIPIETGMAFIVVSDMSIGRDVNLVGILQSATRMTVREIDTQVAAEPNCVYVNIPSTIVTINQSVLDSVPVEHSHTTNSPVDIFFESLANDQGSSAIGIILSGISNYGVKGIQVIKAAQGLTFSKLIDSAPDDEMPSHDATVSRANCILKIDDIVQELACLSSNHVISAQAIQNIMFLPATQKN